MITELNESDARAIVEHARNLSGREMVNSALSQTGSSQPTLDETKSGTLRDHSLAEDRGDHQLQVQVLPAQSSRYRFDDVNHIHLLDDRPLMGTSSVVSVLAKEGLTWWSAELAAVTVMENVPGTQKQISEWDNIRQEYEAMSLLSGKEKKAARDKMQRKYPIFKKARYAHKERKETAAGPGKDMHALLERYIKECIYSHNSYPIASESTWGLTPEVLALHEWACANVEKFLWAEGHCYSETLWTGGICDCGALLKDGTLAFIDFKSSKDAYFGQFVQVGGYCKQIIETGVFTPDGRMLIDVIGHPSGCGCFNSAHLCNPSEEIALIVFPFGAPNPEPVTIRNVYRYCDAFEACVTLHRLQQAFEDL